MFYLLICLFLSISCLEEEVPKYRDLDSISKSDVIANYARNTFYAYKDALVYGRMLQNEISKFVEQPDADSLAKTKKAWLDSRAIFSRSEMFSIHHDLLEEHPGLFEWINGAISHDVIDYTKDDSESGVINSPNRYSSIADFSKITRENLISLNRHDSEIGLIVTGYHAIEFLLWGEDLNSGYSEGKDLLDRSIIGSRPVSDYITHKNAKRRGDYLKIVSSILVDGLSYITREWDPYVEGGYDVYFKAHDVDEVMYSIHKSMIDNVDYIVYNQRFLSVLRGGAEHSPFSDNSLVEIRDNIHGLHFVYTGNYIDGSGRYHNGVGVRYYVSCYVGSEESKAVDLSYEDLVADLSLYIDRGDTIDRSHSFEEIKEKDSVFLINVVKSFLLISKDLNDTLSKSDKALIGKGFKAIGKGAGSAISAFISFTKSFLFQTKTGDKLNGGDLYPPISSSDYYPTPQSAYSGSYIPGSYGPGSQRSVSYIPGPYKSGSYEDSGETYSEGGIYVPVYKPVITKPNNYGCND